MKKHILTPFAAAVLTLTDVRAQEPQHPQPPIARTEPTLVPLATLANAVVHQAQATAGDGGSRAFTPFAIVRDATFTPDGRLIALLVEQAAASGKPAVRRELPAKALLWDASAKRWCTDDPNLTFASLTAVADPAPMVEGAAKGADRPLLASWLADARCATKPAKAGDDGPATATAERAREAMAMLWLAPAQNVIACATIEHAGKRVVLPWAAVKVGDTKDACELHLDAVAARLADAPVCTKADEPPNAALRRRAYEHFGVPIPKWEPAEEHAESPGKRGGDGAR